MSPSLKQTGLLGTRPHKNCKSELLTQKINLQSWKFSTSIKKKKKRKEKKALKISLKAVPSQNVKIFGQ